MRRFLYVILTFSFLLTFLTSCNDSEKIISEKEKRTRLAAMDGQKWIKLIAEEKQEAFDSFVKNMSLEEKICQLFIENLEGDTSFKPVEKLKLISNNPEIDENAYIIPGGFLFFSFNVGKTPEQIIGFTDSIKQYCCDNSKIVPFLAIDQEGGYVNRLKKINGPLPSAETIGKKSDVADGSKIYGLQAQQMKVLGFDLNLAPLGEVCTKDNEQFLTERSFGDYKKVIDYGKVCIDAYESNGIGTVLKHFPGNTNTDPHTGLPEIKLSEKDLFESLEPFSELLKCNPSGVLMSHARTSAIDSKIPACLSYTWVTEILREKFGYDGIIFSDDIFMGALASNGYKPETAVVMAIEAGIDCIMISEKRILKPAKILYQKACEDEKFAEKITESVRRICKFKLENNLLQLIETVKGEYKIVPVYNLSDKSSITAFMNAKNENINLYNSVYR